MMETLKLIFGNETGELAARNVRTAEKITSVLDKLEATAAAEQKLKTLGAVSANGLPNGKAHR